MRRLFSLGAPVALAVALCSAPTTAQAGPVYDFTKITNNGNVDVASQLSMEVKDLGSSMVELVISNTGPTSSVVTKILFDDVLSLLNPSTIVFNPSAGVNFVVAGNTTLPGGNDASPPFSGDYGADRRAMGGVNNGINPGESLGMKYTLNGLNTYADLIAALDSGDFRAGMHVQSIGSTGGSDSYVTTVSRAVPEPSSVLLGTIGLITIGGARLVRRRRLA